MKRSTRNPAKPLQNLEDCSSIEKPKTTKTRKPRKKKDSECKNRCQSSATYSTDENCKLETFRTRSASPIPCSPHIKANLPLKKFYKIYTKTVAQLESIKKLSEEKTNEIDNVTDLKRQLQRADEFSIRFSRNNMYETKRIISEIRQMLAYPIDSLSQNECKVLSKKIILALQAASQSLQIYTNYVKNPLNLEIPDKVNELVFLISELFLCCEQLSLLKDEEYTQNDGFGICNQLTDLLNKKLSIGEYADLKEADLIRKRTKPYVESKEMKRLSMYRSKMNPLLKLKQEFSKKKYGVSRLLASRAKRRKRDEKKAKITEEIYTQKINPKMGKFVKFEPGQKGDAVDRKLTLKKSKFFTPREVRSADDDVETMVQAIQDEDGAIHRTCPPLKELDEASEHSSTLNKSSFRELLLEAIEELQSPDKKEQKATLRKLLNSIQNCSKSQNTTPRPKVKVYHFLSQDLEEERQREKEEKQEEEPLQCVDLVALHAELKAKEEIMAQERRLKIMFRPIRSKKTGEVIGDVRPRGKIKLKLTEEEMADARTYKKSFADYRRRNVMYKKTLAVRSWDLVAKVSDQILLDIIQEISLDFENDDFLQRLYLNELLEVAN